MPRARVTERELGTGSSGPLDDTDSLPNIRLVKKANLLWGRRQVGFLRYILLILAIGVARKNVSRKFLAQIYCIVGMVRRALVVFNRAPRIAAQFI